MWTRRTQEPSAEEAQRHQETFDRIRREANEKQEQERQRLQETQERLDRLAGR